MRPCVLGGYPGLQLLSSSGAALPTKVIRGGHYTFTSMAPTTVTLTTGQSVYFNLGYSDVPVGNETSCPTSSSLEVTPPNSYTHLVVAASLAPCGGGTAGGVPGVRRRHQHPDHGSLSTRLRYGRRSGQPGSRRPYQHAAPGPAPQHRSSAVGNSSKPSSAWTMSSSTAGE